jgi:uncharacterized repeat protein (TIGR03803 family)
MSKINWMTTAVGVLLLWAAAAVALPAQTLTTLQSFDGTNGAAPQGTLVQGIDGNFYGTTVDGGNFNSLCGSGCGTVFKIAPSGALTTLHSFDGTDGQLPSAGLVQGTDGSFYGTTAYGGTNRSGTVFKITSSGALTTLYNFCSQSNCPDGANPVAPLAQGLDGSFYGTTVDGGANLDGTIFKITPNGTLATLYMFCSQAKCKDGDGPDAGLVQVSNGDFYGTTEYGGDSENCELGCGTIFRITPSGTLTTLHSFDFTDGEGPVGTLAWVAEGSFYGITYAGGTSNACPSNCGTVFSITPSGSLTTLHSFDDTDGRYPFAALVQGTDGNFYGTTYNGGANSQFPCIGGCGTLFVISPSGTLTTLYSFCSLNDCADGYAPYAALIQGTNGTFYGTTQSGKASGTVFSLSVGLRPFVEVQPTSGPVGGTVKILGTKLTGATSVTFNGTPAVFTVDSHSLIITTVPAGATSGKVQVSGPGGTGSSNVPFTVK